jgi:hypothetical protein
MNVFVALLPPIRQESDVTRRSLPTTIIIVSVVSAVSTVSVTLLLSTMVVVTIVGRLQRL